VCYCACRDSFQFEQFSDGPHKFREANLARPRFWVITDLAMPKSMSVSVMQYYMEADSARYQ